MTDKEKIRAYIESQIALLDKNNIDNPVLGVSAGIVMSELKHLLSFIDSLQEEPVSDDLEKVFDKYSEELESDYSNDMFDRGDIFRACKFGAQWQKEQIMKDAISMDVYYETEWDDIHKFLRKNLDGEKVKLLIIKEE